MPNPKFKILLYYKYHPIKNPEKFTKEQKDFCEEHNLLGRIIIAEEGISGTCAGTIENADSYVDYVHSLQGFEDVIFKEHLADSIPFKKLKIKLKKEIVVSRFKDIDLSKRGKYISPEEFNELYEKSKTDNSIVIFDDRMQVIFDDNGNTITSNKIPKDKIISSCDFCGIKSSRVVNDERKHERHLVVCCEVCDMKLDVSRVRYKIDIKIP